mmetsp:Transcript_7690/g.10799  ORF Transcript_7690/g.10799 Transcript_7690/m.10799 type:complete len:248 (+) Transcript_7690:1-744(+)
MPLIVIECMHTPDSPRKLFFFPCDIPSKFYPIALFGLFSLFSGVRIDMALSLLVGYAYSAGKLDRLKPSNARLKSWDEGCLRNFANREGYVVAGGGGSEPWLPLNNPGRNPPATRGVNGVSTLSQVQTQQPRASEVNKAIKDTEMAFKGSGRTLGGSGNGLRNGSGASSARALRLAAIEARGNSKVTENAVNSENFGTEVSSSLLANTDHEIMVLQDMGYSVDEAREALRVSNGDISQAANYLSESR